MTALGAGRYRPPGRMHEPLSGCYFLKSKEKHRLRRETKPDSGAGAQDQADI